MIGAQSAITTPILFLAATGNHKRASNKLSIIENISLSYLVKIITAGKKLVPLVDRYMNTHDSFCWANKRSYLQLQIKLSKHIRKEWNSDITW